MCFAEPGVFAGVGRRLLVAEHVALVQQHRGGGRAFGGISVPLDFRIGWRGTEGNSQDIQAPRRVHGGPGRSEPLQARSVRSS